MPRPPSSALLKLILDNLATPECLDDHPWARSRMVAAECERNPALRGRSPGVQLAVTVAGVFRQLMPPAPPRQGKRLDTRWGEFGLLAARYFAPFLYGTPYPVSLRQAWHGIDAAIQLFVFDGTGAAAGEAERRLYQLVAGETEIAPESTISDWHRQGLHRLAGAVEARQRHAENHALFHAPSASRGRGAASVGRLRKPFKVAVLLALAALLLLAVFLGVRKGQRVYERAQVLQADIVQLQREVTPADSIASLQKAGPALGVLRGDLKALRLEVDPLLPLAPWLSWVPVYGGDLAAAPRLLELADLLLQSGQESYDALHPLLTALDGNSALGPGQVAELLNAAQPELAQARGHFDRAVQVRQGLDLATFSPRTRSLLEQRLDPLLPAMDDGLALAMALPRFLGAASDGPKTYLIVAQNEDELRPTGGFITAAGTLLLKDGQVASLGFEDSGELDNWDELYPPAPWQLDEYMNSPVLVLRDANWFTDFPTSALYLEYLYAYHNAHSVDGVIAFDQHLLVMILQTLGPIQVDGASQPVDAGNVIAFMRSAKTPPTGQTLPEGWARKSFMNSITAALLKKVFSGEVPWLQLARTLLRGLEQHDLLLQMDDPVLAGVLARHGWNGAVEPGPADFLMVVDSNIGFNKTNAVVKTRLIYDVNLLDLAKPTSRLSVIHQNGAKPGIDCIQWGAERQPGEAAYPINACYWDYMRVYLPAGTRLLDAQPQTVPTAWMMMGHSGPGAVDILDDEDIDSVQAFGTLLVVPTDNSLATGFHFALPPTVLQRDPLTGRLTYQLTVKKQPGVQAAPFTLRVHLPPGASVASMPPGAVLYGSNLLFEASLDTDLVIQLVFAPR